MIKPRLWAFFSLLLFFASQALAAQESSCPTDPARHSFKEWIKRVGLDYGKQYTAPLSRKKQITENYEKIKIGMTRAEVEKIIGSPDVEQPFRTPRGLSAK